MPIAIMSEHNDLAASVRSLVARVAPSEVLHEALETPISNPPPYWGAAADQGLQGLHLSEAVGGQGFGIIELAITGGPLVLLWFLMWGTLDLGYWLSLLLAVPAAGFLVRIFMIQRDCGHGAFFHRRVAGDPGSVP